MAATKTLFFSCPYSFYPIGVDAFISRYRNSFEDPKEAPFIAYNPKDNVFSTIVDRLDETTAHDILSQLKWFILETINSSNIDEPRIRPASSLVARKTLVQDFDQNPGLLEVFDEEGSDSGDENAPQAMQHITAYWYPKQGDIRILTTAVAESIASLTGCHMYPEPHENRVRLVSGDFTSALRKLQNMEDLLTLQHQHRGVNSARATANILLPIPAAPDESMRFCSMNDPSRLSFGRVIVDSQAAPFLVEKYVCETFRTVIDDDNNDTRRDQSPNLTLEGVFETRTTTTESCAIWKDYVYKSMGDESNKEPEVLELAPGVESELNSQAPKFGASDYLEPAKAAGIAAWTGRTREGLDMEDPHSSRPEPPIEPTSGRIRRPALDSDDEDEDDSQGDKIPRDPDGMHASASIPVQSAEKPSALAPLGGRDKVNDLISLSSVSASFMVGNYTGPQGASGLSVFGGDFPERDLLGTSTVASNLLDCQSRSSQPVSDRGASRPISPMGREAQNDKRNPFSVLDSSISSDEHHNHTTTHDTPVAVMGQDETAISSSEGWEVVCSNKPKSKPKQNQLKTFDGAFSDHVTSTSDGSQPNLKEHQVPSKTSLQNALPTSSSPATARDGHGLPPTFDRAAYGRPSRGIRGLQHGRDTSNSTSSRMPDIVSSVMRARQHGSPPSRARGNLFRGRGSRLQHHQESLVDVATPLPNLVSKAPPPGLEIQLPSTPGAENHQIATRSPEAPNLIDEPLEDFRKPSSRTNSDLISFSSDGRTYPPRNPLSSSSQHNVPEWIESREYENHIPYRPNIRARNEAALQHLISQQSSSRPKGVQPARGLAKKAPDDQQQFRSTMSQKAGNPGKRKGGKAKAETAEQARLRKQKALEDAYGGPMAATKLVQSQVPTDAFSDMSAAKQRLLKTNGNMASFNSEALQRAAVSQTTDQVISALRSIFEAGRAFTGELQFEVQFGQALLTSNGQIETDKTVSARSWDRLIGSFAKPNGPVTSFTNTLTTNGADINRVLEVKASSAPFKLWGKSIADQSKLAYEFHCQSKQGLDFWLVVEENGAYKITNMRHTVGMVALHCPAHVWDAAAVLQGRENWNDPPTAIVEAVSEFVNSIYVLPDRRQLALIFRQPKNLEITVRNVLMKRISRHQCQLMDHHDLFLQVTEIKTLSTKIHPADKRLWQAFEKNHDSMIQEGTVHYELSIVDKGVNEVLAQNKDLEVGELTPENSTGKSLLRMESISMMLNLTIYMLTKIDWMGFNNYGTLPRMAHVAQEQRALQHQSLPPTARSRLHQPVLPASRAQTRFGGSIMGESGLGSRDPYVGLAPIRTPGTRANTTAEVYEDSGGSFYAIGMGGARIPVPFAAISGGLGTIGEEVGPDDSASQAGMPRTSRANGPKRQGDSRGPGFW